MGKIGVVRGGSVDDLVKGVGTSRSRHEIVPSTAFGHWYDP